MTLVSSPKSRVTFVDIVDVPDRKTHPNVYHWYLFLRMFTPDAQKTWTSHKAEHKHEAKKDAKKDKDVKEVKKEEAKKEEEFDLFGADDTPAPKKEEAKPAAPAKVKKAVIAKSILVFDVKIFEADTDLEKLAQRVYEIKMDGYSIVLIQISLESRTQILGRGLRHQETTGCLRDRRRQGFHRRPLRDHREMGGCSVHRCLHHAEGVMPCQI